MSDDIRKAVEQACTDLAFARQVRSDARRTLICHPDDEHRVRASVDQHFAEDILTVQTSPVGPPPGTMYVIDDAGLDASMAKAVQGFLREPVYSGLGLYRSLVEKLHASRHIAPSQPELYPPYADWMPNSHRTGPRAPEFQRAIEQALLTGEHVHSFGSDGFKCVSGECE